MNQLGDQSIFMTLCELPVRLLNRVAISSRIPVQ